ncbi:hypothetical protein DRA43_06110 [Micromonospora provocatoris]|nr:hypothetical protein [Micromonospora provocatoris]RBJ08628.1 hypothetical protein DRA43_06110 [Micromonospora provocatoris]
MTTAIGQLDDPADVVRLADLHSDQAFRQGLTNLVWDKLAPRRADPQTGATTRPVDAAAVAATAFVPSAGAGALTPDSPAPATPQRVAHHDHAHVPER